MGDRVLITFTDDGETFTPAVYMHWNGSEAADWIRAAARRMRKGDAGYAAARFCGECHKQISGHNSLGLLDAPNKGAAGIDWTEYSHGDAGVYIVNVSTGEVSAWGGYGKPFKIDPALFAAG